MKKRDGARSLGGVASEQPVESSPESRKRAAAGLIEATTGSSAARPAAIRSAPTTPRTPYQRALEILLTKAPPIEGDYLVRWMQAVTKREALGVRRQRERLLSAPRPPTGRGGPRPARLDRLRPPRTRRPRRQPRASREEQRGAVGAEAAGGSGADAES